MNTIKFSQQHLNPLPQYYQGSDILELAHQCFIDWKDVHQYGELHEFLAQVQAINHAAHWLQADITAHAELKHTLHTLNKTIISKNKMLRMCQHPSRRGSAFAFAAEELINDAEGQISVLQARRAKTKATIRAIKEQRYRSSMIEIAYRILSSGHDFLGPDNDNYYDNSEMTALQPNFWAVEQLTRLIFLAVEAEMEGYIKNMSRLSRDLASKLAMKMAVAEERLRLQQEQEQSESDDGENETTVHNNNNNDFLSRLQQDQQLLTRLIETKGGLNQPSAQTQPDSTMETPNTVSEIKVEIDEPWQRKKYLGQIARYWSRWDVDGYAEREFKLVWEFVAGRRCVVWSR